MTLSSPAERKDSVEFARFFYRTVYKAQITPDWVLYSLGLFSVCGHWLLYNDTWTDYFVMGVMAYSTICVSIIGFRNLRLLKQGTQEMEKRFPDVSDIALLAEL